MRGCSRGIAKGASTGTRNARASGRTRKDTFNGCPINARSPQELPITTCKLGQSFASGASSSTKNAHLSNREHHGRRGEKKKEVTTTNSSTRARSVLPRRWPSPRCPPRLSPWTGTRSASRQGGGYGTTCRTSSTDCRCAFKIPPSVLPKRAPPGARHPLAHLTRRPPPPPRVPTRERTVKPFRSPRPARPPRAWSRSPPPGAPCRRRSRSRRSRSARTAGRCTR